MKELEQGVSTRSGVRVIAVLKAAKAMLIPAAPSSLVRLGRSLRGK